MFARHIQGQDGRRVGEIAFIGSGRTAPRDPGATALPRNLRVIAIPDNVENVGLRKVGMRRSGADSELWEIYVAVRNYGVRPHDRDPVARFRTSRGRAGRVAAGSRALTWRRARSRKLRSNIAPAPRACWASICPRTTASQATTMPSWNCRRSLRCP